MAQPLELLLIRHGESQFNLDGSGGFDSVLTDLGREQARRLASWLAANFDLAAFYSSTMLRARETAEMIQPAIKLPIQFRDDLNEADFDIGLAMPQFADPLSAMDGHIVHLEDLSSQYVEFQSRVVRRCFRCGRKRGYLGDFALCRICFRELAWRSEIPGLVKASW